MKKYVVLAVFILIVVSGVGCMRRPDTPDTPPVSTSQAPRPSPIDEQLPRPPVVIAAETVRTRVADTVEAAGKSPEKELGGTNWAVVVAIYKQYEAAEKRARGLGENSDFKAVVFPPEGQGNKYMVVLEDGLTHGKAMQIRDRAVAKGLPADTYITRLGTN